MTSSTSSSRLAAVLAVVAPVAIVASALAFLGRPTSDATEDVAPALASCRTRMERTGDDVVVVGNSKSQTDIDRVALAKALGVKAVGAVGMPGSSAPLWYAALSRCVFEAGHRPKLVVVYATPGALLRATVDSERERLALAPYLGEPDPVLDQKVFGGAPASPFWQRVSTRKTELLLGLQHGVRDGVAGLLFAPAGPDGLLASGRAYAEPALEKVLGADAGSEALSRHRAIPIADAGADPAAARDTTLADTLVPDLVALAEAHGARFVYVQAPVSAAKAAGFDRAAPALLRETVLSFNAEGAGYVDLTGLGLPATAYGDGVHMNAAGRGLLTTALADRLAAIDALGTGPFAAAAVPRPAATVSRVGTPAALPTPAGPTRGPGACGWQLTVKALDGVSDSTLNRAGHGAVSPIVLLEDGTPLPAHAKREAFDLACAGAASHQGSFVKFSPTGGPAEVVASRTYTLALSEELPLRDAAGRDAWWVYPGTTLRADAPEGWEAPLDGFAVRVEAVVALPGASPASLAWNGATAPLSPNGPVSAATLPGAAPAGPWSVEVTSPPDGPWLLVQRVVAGTEAAPWHVVGAPDAGRTVDFFKGEAAWAADPPPIGSLGPIVATGEGTWRLDTAALGAPDSDAIGKRSGLNRCSPVRVAEDGVPLTAPNSGVRKLAETAGAYAHTAAGILFTASDRTDPQANGRTYTATLDPSRTCLTSRWLYPGDVARFRIGARHLAALSAGSTRLHLTGVAIGEATGASAADLTVRVLVGTEEVFATALPLADLAAASPEHALPRPITRDSPDVVVELSTPPGAPYTLLTALALTEPARPAFPPPAASASLDAALDAAAAPSSDRAPADPAAAGSP